MSLMETAQEVITMLEVHGTFADVADGLLEFNEKKNWSHGGWLDEDNTEKGAVELLCKRARGMDYLVVEWQLGCI